jgi:hypothetical protein
LTERTSKDTGVSATPTGAHIWADGFDRSIKNIFDLQNQVTASVVGAIALKMERGEIERARRKPTEKWQGMPRTRQATRQAYDDAPFIWAFATRAIRLSPFAGLAFGHMFAGRCSEHDHDER